jgi:hypothetical protein
MDEASRALGPVTPAAVNDDRKRGAGLGRPLVSELEGAGMLGPRGN